MIFGNVIIFLIVVYCIINLRFFQDFKAEYQKDYHEKFNKISNKNNIQPESEGHSVSKSSITKKNPDRFYHSDYSDTHDLYEKVSSKNYTNHSEHAHDSENLTNYIEVYNENPIKNLYDDEEKEAIQDGQVGFLYKFYKLKKYIGF